MGSLLDMLRSVFDARTSDQRDTLAVTRFHGVSDVFEQVRAQIPLEWTQAGATNQAQQRAMVFFALATARMRLEHEANVLSHLGQGQAVSPLLDHGCADDHVYLVMPFVPGITLHARLRRG